MSEQQYFVMVDGQKLGPFDQRTITGMRVKKILTDDQKVYHQNGLITTVRELVGASAATGRFETSSPLSTGIMYPKFIVHFMRPAGSPYGQEHFVGDGELRVQPDVLRVAGQIRPGLWKKLQDHRVKVPRDHVTWVRRIEHVVELRADRLPGWPQSGFFTFGFDYPDDARAFCDALEGRHQELPGVAPDVLL